MSARCRFLPSLSSPSALPSGGTPCYPGGGGLWLPGLHCLLAVPPRNRTTACHTWKPLHKTKTRQCTFLIVFGLEAWDTERQASLRIPPWELSCAAPYACAVTPGGGAAPTPFFAVEAQGALLSPAALPRRELQKAAGTLPPQISRGGSSQAVIQRRLAYTASACNDE